MKTILILAAAILGSPQEERPRPPDRVPTPESPAPWDGRSDDLWYGASGVRPGGDLLEPLLDLVRKPSSLFDFRPRKVPSYLPDRETAEFLRERR